MWWVDCKGDTKVILSCGIAVVGLLFQWWPTRRAWRALAILSGVCGHLLPYAQGYFPCCCVSLVRVGWGKMGRFSDILINNFSLYSFKFDFFSDFGH
jgi:hypothetical protein